VPSSYSVGKARSQAGMEENPPKFKKLDLLKKQARTAKLKMSERMKLKIYKINGK